MDIEDEIYAFFVRKEHNLSSNIESDFIPRNGNKSKQHDNRDENVHNYIPLMLKHIQTLKEDSWEGCTTNIKSFNGNVRFKHCLVYGKIMGKGKETKATYNYLLDDGTACIDIKIFRRAKELETVWKLENELEGVKKVMMSQNKNEIAKSLRNVLLKTKQQLDNSNIPVGCKVLVYGKPSYYRGHISLNAYYITQDGSADRDIEITFKDKLINWYCKNLFV